MEIDSVKIISICVMLTVLVLVCIPIIVGLWIDLIDDIRYRKIIDTDKISINNRK